MTKKREVIEHTFPVLGRIEVPLHQESAELLRALNGLPFSGPDHWQSLDHLGELRSVLKCGHHSRYEYPACSFVKSLLASAVNTVKYGCISFAQPLGWAALRVSRP